MKKQKNYIKMTRDVVFKKFFVDKPDILKRVLKHFLNIPEIMKLEIKNPGIPELEENKQKPQNKQTEGIKSADKKQSLEMFDTNLPVEHLGGKKVSLDLRVKLSSGEDINIEVQTCPKPSFLKRVLLYWSKLHA
ncbi:MAG: PD-(D/E)XK nuclease family transposase, partial [Bdellovibrionales bacterium]|nr:PD-(D/E)XK nuclease family transposase [Bdellovibrionales bacterium]